MAKSPQTLQSIMDDPEASGRVATAARDFIMKSANTKPNPIQSWFSPVQSGLDAMMGKPSNSDFFGGKKKAPKMPATPKATEPLTDPTWANQQVSPEARTDLLRVMMQRSRGMNQPQQQGQGSSKGPQDVPPGGV